MQNLKYPQIAHLDRALEARERELREEIRALLLRSDEQHHREFAGTVGDAGDESVANLLADLDAAFLDRQIRELREIEDARRKIAAGNYGLCSDCGCGIEWERLAAHPTATRCARCAQRHEKSHAHEGTPTL